MNLDRLEVFLRIVETGSMGAASRVLHLTQPALSHSLKLLEEELGTPLFERQGRGLVLTAAGRALEPRARALLESAQAIARDVGRTAAQRYHDLRIGTVEKIRDLVMLQLPGIGIQPMAVAPRQIPYHAGFVYFELDKSNELWRSLKTSGGVAFHQAGEFPGLSMEFWAIRS